MQDGESRTKPGFLNASSSLALPVATNRAHGGVETYNQSIELGAHRWRCNKPDGYVDWIRWNSVLASEHARLIGATIRFKAKFEGGTPGAHLALIHFDNISCDGLVKEDFESCKPI